MDVTAIMEKTVKNTGGVAALQKMPKNYENTGSWLQFVTNSKGGYILSYPFGEHSFVIIVLSHTLALW